MPDFTQLLAANPELKKQFDGLPANDKAIIMREIGPAQGDSRDAAINNYATNSQKNLAVAQQTGSTMQEAAKQRSQQILAQGQTTPEQQLREDNSPLSKGFGAMADEAIAGGSSAITGQGALSGTPLDKIPLLQRILGLGQLANSPAVGAGNAAGTFVQNQLSRLPIPQALGGGAGGVIPAGAAALTDALVQVGPKIALAPVAAAREGLAAGGRAVIEGAQSGLTPALMRTGAKFLKEAGQVPARILSPGIVRDAGATVVREALGSPSTLLEKVFTTPASKTAYQLAEAKGPMATADLADTMQQAFFKHDELALKSQKALNAISKIEQRFTANPQMGYGQVMEEVQSLKALADGALNSTAPESKILAKTLLDARENLISAMDKTSPVYKHANMLYRQETATTDIMNAMRSGTPGRQLEKLIENHPDVARSFSPQVVKDISYTAKQLSDVASETPAGGFRQALQALSKPVMDVLLTGNPLGRMAIKNALKAPKEQLAQRLGAAVQLYRASGGAAQQGNE